jgi:hypothetical protein
LTLPTGEQIFLARDGLRLFNGISASLIDAPINDEIRDYMNPLYAFKSWAKIVREYDEVWIGIPIGNDTEPSTIYKFNYVTRQIHKDYRTDLLSVADYKNTIGQVAWDDLPSTWDAWVGPWNDIVLASLNRIIVFGTSGGVTTRQNSGSSDNGVAISGEWESKDFTSEDYGLDAGYLMNWQELEFWIKGSGTMKVYYSKDGGISYQYAGAITLSSYYPGDTSPQILYIDDVSAMFRLKLVHDEDNKTFTMKNFAIVAVQREVARS